MIIAPSILSADFGKLAESVALVKDAKWLHVDVMDGHFVPNISIGPIVVKGLRPYTTQVLDTHLMISEPGKYEGKIAVTFEKPNSKQKTTLNSVIQINAFEDEKNTVDKGNKGKITWQKALLSSEK